MKIYIHKDTGVATAALSDTTPLATLTGVLGATYHLDCVFHDGTAPVELASGASGVLIVKQDKHFTDPVIFGALSWTKFSAPGDGYRFTTVPAGDALLTLLANLDTIPLMAFIAFLNGGDLLITQKISFVVKNSGYRVDETVPPLLPSVWPAPDTIALKTDIQPAIVAFMTPGNLTVPTISANTHVDQLFEATPGTWTKNPTAFSYQWQFSTDLVTWANIPGETNASITPATLVTKHIRVGVVAANEWESSAPAYSAASAVLAAPSGSTSPLASGLLAFYNLDEESGVRVDATGNGNDLTDLNGTTYTAGRIGNAAASDGSMGLQSGKDFGLRDLDGYSVFCWSNSTSDGGAIIGNWFDGWEIGASDGSGSVVYGPLNLHGPVIIDGNWHHVGLVKDGNTFTFYVDGIPVATADGPLGIAYPAGLSVLCDGTGNDRSTGAVDLVGIWNRAITTDEIAQLFNGGNGLAYPFA